jgi:hypothetical protein
MRCGRTASLTVPRACACGVEGQHFPDCSVVSASLGWTGASCLLLACAVLSQEGNLPDALAQGAAQGGRTKKKEMLLLFLLRKIFCWWFLTDH